MTYLFKWLNVSRLSEKPIFSALCVGSDYFLPSPSKVATVNDWPLPEILNHAKFIVDF
jgi:hypothetical protein